MFDQPEGKALRAAAERGLEQQGYAAGMLVKVGAKPENAVVLSGRLELSSSGWLLLSAPNALVRGLFQALDVAGVELPLRDGVLNAHCTVMTADEVAAIGADRISERGKLFKYQIGPIKTVRPSGWRDVAVVYMISIISPALKKLRRSYGLPELPFIDHDFHITCAIKRKGVLQDGPISKAGQYGSDTPVEATTRAFHDSGVRQLGVDEGALSDQIVSDLQELRGQGHNDLRKLAEELLDLPERHGSAAPWHFTRTQEEQRRVRAGQLCVGDVGAAVAKHAEIAEGRLRGADLELDGSGRSQEIAEGVNSSSSGSRVVAGGGSKHTAAEEAAQRQISDTQRTNTLLGRLGKESRSARVDVDSSITWRHGLGASLIHAGFSGAEKQGSDAYRAYSDSRRVGGGTEYTDLTSACSPPSWLVGLCFAHDRGAPAEKYDKVGGVRGQAVPLNGVSEAARPVPPRVSQSDREGYSAATPRAAETQVQDGRHGTHVVRMGKEARGSDIVPVLQVAGRLVERGDANNSDRAGAEVAQPRHSGLKAASKDVVDGCDAKWRSEHPGEYCPHCFAVHERDPYTAECNRCGKVHGEPSRKAASDENAPSYPQGVQPACTGMLNAGKAVWNSLPSISSLFGRTSRPSLPTATIVKPPSLGPATMSKAGDFAEGIPSKDDYGDPTRLPKGLVDWFVQTHDARRAGLHRDVRLGLPETGLLSWATKNDLPEPGDRKAKAWYQTNLHRHSYGKFQGELKGGYGAGRVTRADLGEALVTDTSPNKLEFTLAHRKQPSRFQLIRPEGLGPRTWLARNTTPTEPLKEEKVRYKSIPPEEAQAAIDSLPEGSVAQPKVDGASALIELTRRGPEMYSYRADAKSGHPIIHTERVFGERPRATYPRDLIGSILRGELYGIRQPEADRGGAAGRDHERGGHGSVLEGVHPQARGAGERGDAAVAGVGAEGDADDSAVSRRGDLQDQQGRLPRSGEAVRRRGEQDGGSGVVPAVGPGFGGGREGQGLRVPASIAALAELRGIGNDQAVGGGISGDEQSDPGSAWPTGGTAGTEAGVSPGVLRVRDDRGTGGDSRGMGEVGRADPAGVLPEARLQPGARVIHPQHLGAILNSTLANSLRKQEREGIDLKAMLFDIQRHGDKPVDLHTTPYAERRKLLEGILPHLPQGKFHLAPQVEGKDAIRRLHSDVTQDRVPLTREGIVIHPPTGKPLKLKATEEFDTVITGTYPGEGRRLSTIGGLTYAHPDKPDVTVGKVGTGFSDDTLSQIAADPKAFIGRVMRLKAQERLASGALRGPSLIALHEDTPAAKTAADGPYRERAEIFALDHSGKLYGGKWDQDRSFAVPGGGIDPGEDIASAGAREFLEETGLRAVNPRLLPLPPVINSWSEAHRAKLPPDRRHFLGSRMHFVAAELPSLNPESDKLDTWKASERGLYSLQDALRIMRTAGEPMFRSAYDARLRALRHLHQEQRRAKTANYSWPYIGAGVGAGLGAGAGLLGEYATRPVGLDDAARKRRQWAFGLGGAGLGGIGGALYGAHSAIGDMDYQRYKADAATQAAKNDVERLVQKNRLQQDKYLDEQAALKLDNSALQDQLAATRGPNEAIIADLDRLITSSSPNREAVQAFLGDPKRLLGDPHSLLYSREARSLDGYPQLKAHINPIIREHIPAFEAEYKAIADAQEASPANFTTRLRPEVPRMSRSPQALHAEIYNGFRQALHQPDDAWLSRPRTLEESTRYYTDLHDRTLRQLAPFVKKNSNTHTSFDGTTYNIDGLMELLKNRPVERLPLDGLRLSRDSRTGFSRKRYSEADTAYPGIVDPEGGLLDGRHRALKLRDAGETHGQFRRATDEDMAAVKMAGLWDAAANAVRRMASVPSTTGFFGRAGAGLASRAGQTLKSTGNLAFRTRYPFLDRSIDDVLAIRNQRALGLPGLPSGVAPRAFDRTRALAGTALRYGPTAGTASVAAAGTYHKAMNVVPNRTAGALKAEFGLDDQTTEDIANRARTELPRMYPDILAGAAGYGSDQSAIGKIHYDAARDYLSKAVLQDIPAVREKRPVLMGAVDLLRSATPFGAALSAGLRSIPKGEQPDFGAYVRDAMAKHKDEILANPAAQLDSPYADMWRRIMFPIAQGGGQALPAVVNHPQVQQALQEHVAPRIEQSVSDLVHDTARSAILPAPPATAAPAATTEAAPDPWAASRQLLTDAGRRGVQSGIDASRYDPEIRARVRNAGLIGGAGLLAGGLGTAGLIAATRPKRKRREDEEQEA